MSKSKTITGWLVVDWKSGKHRTRKSKPSTSELGTNELVAKLNVDVSVPEVDVPTLAVEIDVPEPQVYAATLEALDDRDMPDWSTAAIEAIDDYRDLFTGDAHDFETGVDRATVAAMSNAPGRPDISNVREFVKRTARDIDDDGVAPVPSDGDK